MVAFRVEAGDAGLSLGPEAPQALRIGLAGANRQHQCKRRNNAGMQSPHDCNPFLLEVRFCSEVNVCLNSGLSFNSQAAREFQ
jgi:hypothetical protein